MKKSIITYAGLVCLILATLGQFIFNWPTTICSLLAGAFLFTLFKGSQSAQKNREQKEQDRQERIRSLGR